MAGRQVRRGRSRSSKTYFRVPLSASWCSGKQATKYSLGPSRYRSRNPRSAPIPVAQSVIRCLLPTERKSFLSAHVGLLIDALGVDRVLDSERAEDDLSGGVSIGVCAISLGV